METKLIKFQYKINLTKFSNVLFENVLFEVFEYIIDTQYDNKN